MEKWERAMALKAVLQPDCSTVAGQQQVNLKTSTIPEAQGEVKLVFLLVLRREVISVVPLSGLSRILMIRQ